MHGRFAEKADSHITLLEGIPYVLLLRHLASSVSMPIVSFRDSVLSVSQNEVRRIFVGLDSKGALGAGAKGRSSAFRLNRSCRKTCATSPASGIVAYFHGLPSEIMLMDAPSRKFKKNFSKPADKKPQERGSGVS